MHRFLLRSLPFHKLLLLIIAIATIFLYGCQQNDDNKHNELKKQLRAVDSLIIAGKGDSAMVLLNKLRPRIPQSDPLICIYYHIETEHNALKPKVMNLYADSSLAFFNNAKTMREYPEEYLQALLSKGDACLAAKNYIAALNYYYKSKEVLSKTVCDNGNLANKISAIYFEQKNYKQAARYCVESYNRLEQCHENINEQKLFFIKQGALNNIGFFYEKAGMLDSANYYYLKDVDYISKTNIKVLGMHSVNSALQVVYDNLGGVNLKKSNLAIADTFLNKSINLPGIDDNAAKTPPLLKLADLYIRTGDKNKAQLAFNESKKLLDSFPDKNRTYEISWNKLYAQYLYKTGNPADAYRYQERYINLRDSVDNSSTVLYRLDVQQVLSILKQKQTLSELEQDNKVKRIYLACFIIFGILAVAIILMINQILKKTKENQKDIKVHNQELQHTLDQLEHVNKNYIRIMRVMAHDLRNPLSGITGLAAMLLDEDEQFSDESRHMLKLIEKTGIHSMEMINELLKSGLSNEDELVVKQLLDLNSLLYDSVELLQFKAKEKQQQIIFESSGVPLMAEINHEKIWRVINNLIVNAIKFSHPAGIITVGIKKENKNILISVADNGIGIPEKEKESVFEMFTPAKKLGTNGEQAFGLGLSISKRIIELHKGKIWFENNPDGGTTFYIEIPGS